MNKQEFLNKLRAALNGRVPTNVVTENVNYYEDYINTQIRMGRTEEEVLQALGDPRLLAKTIIETNGRSTGYREGNGGFAEDYRENGYQDPGQNRYGKVHRVPGWLWVIIVVLVIVVIMGVVLSVISFLAPFLLAILVVMFLVKLFRDWLN